MSNGVALEKGSDVVRNVTLKKFENSPFPL